MLRTYRTWLAPVAILLWLALVSWHGVLLLSAHVVTTLNTRLSVGSLVSPVVLGAALLAAAAAMVLLATRIVAPGRLHIVWALGVGSVWLLLAVTSGQVLAILATLWLVIVAGLIGLTILTWVGVSLAPAATAGVALALGFGCLALLTLALGLVGWLTLPIVWPLTLALALILGRVSRYAVAGWWAASREAWLGLAPLPWEMTAWLAPLTLLAVVTWLGALAPEIMFDALKSHLFLADIYASTGSVMGLPYSMGSYWPMTGDMLFTLAFLLGGETAAKLMHFVAGAATALLIYALGRAVASPRTGVAAALAFCLTPVVAWEMMTAYVDLFLTLFVAGALMLVLVWRTRPSDWRLATAIGLLLGFALGIKPSGAFVAVGVGLVMLVEVWRQRAGRAGLLALVAVVVATVVSGGPWYLRAYLLTGNPIFPFMNGLFHSPLWYPRNTVLYIGGIGLSPAALVTIPWRLTFETKRFGGVDGWAGILVLAFAPVGLVYLRRAPGLGVIAFVTLVFSVGWAISAQNIRYFLPGLVGVALLAGWGMTEATRLLRQGWPRLRWFVPVYGAVMACLFLPVALANHLTTPTRVPYDVVLGRMDRADYLARTVPSYQTFQHVNAELGTDSRIYAVAEYFQYLSRVPLVTPFYSPEGDRILQAASAAEAIEALRAARITHVLVNWQWLPAGWQALIHQRAFLEQHADLEYEANGVALYRLRPSVLAGAAESGRLAAP
jgi:hypothetical protein